MGLDQMIKQNQMDWISCIFTDLKKYFTKEINSYQRNVFGYTDNIYFGKQVQTPYNPTEFTGSK